jgi:putative copper export protein
LLVWEPALRETPVESGPGKDYRQQLLQLGLAVFLFANILFLLFQAGQALGGEIAAPWDTAVGNVLFNTRSGALWLARVSLALALECWGARGRRRGLPA